MLLVFVDLRSPLQVTFRRPATSILGEYGYLGGCFGTLPCQGNATVNGTQRSP